MPIKHTTEDGDEIDAFTSEEVKAKDDAIAAKEAELATIKAEAETAKAEVEKYKRVATEQTTNFKKLNDLTEAEKTALSSEKLEAMKRFEAAEARAAALEEKINTDTKTRIQSDTDSALAKYHGGDEKLKKALEENFKIINLEGTDTATIQERARLAASMEKGKADRINPLHTNFGGSAPRSQEKSKTEEFLKSEKAKAALKAMGEKVD